MSNLIVFGCTAYAHQSVGKLEPRALKCIFIGYPEGTKGYSLWVKDKHGLKTIISRDVVFKEDDFPYVTNSLTSAGTSLQTNNAGTRIDYQVAGQVQIPDTNQVELDNQIPNIYQVEPNIQDQTEQVDLVQNDPVTDNCSKKNLDTDEQTESETSNDYQLTRDRAKRILKPNQNFMLNVWEEVLAYAYLGVTSLTEPNTFEEAITGKEANKSHATMDEEMASLNKTKTWILVTKPQGRSVVACKGLFM